MTILNYSALVTNKTNFTPGQDTKIFLSTPYNFGNIGSKLSLTMGSPPSGATAGSGAVITPVVNNGSIVDLIINNGGSGYNRGVNIRFLNLSQGGSGGDDETGVDAAGANLIVTNGVITSYSNLYGGSGYNPPSQVRQYGYGQLTPAGAYAQISSSYACSVPIGSGAIIQLTVSGGTVTSATVLNGGTNYWYGTSGYSYFSGNSSYPYAKIGFFAGYPGNNTFSGYGTTNSNGVVTGFTISNAGSGIPNGTYILNIKGATSASYNGTVSIDGGRFLSGNISFDLSSPTTYPLYEGTRLIINDNIPIVVSQYVPLGSYNIPFLKQYLGAPLNSVSVSALSWIPLFSINQCNLEHSSVVISEQVMNGNLNTIKASIGIDNKFTAQGVQVYNDPGLEILQRAYQNAQLVNITVLKGNQRGGYSFAAWVSGLPESIQRIQYVDQIFNFEISGAVTYFDV
jgi:hypothetical protein